jgi:hypothetical protein
MPSAFLGILARLNDESPKRDEVTGDWRKLHNEDFHNLYTSPSVHCVSRFY